MIEAVAFCPQAPVLVEPIAGAAAAEFADVRSAAVAAIRDIADDLDRLILLAGGMAGRSGWHTGAQRASLRPFGAPLVVSLPGPGAATELPVECAVGCWLVAEALPGRTVSVAAAGPDFADSPAIEQLRDYAAAASAALVVFGDGTASRAMGAPGEPDPAADAFDAAVERALGSGDPAALAELAVAAGVARHAGGLAAWQAAASILDAAFDATLDHRADPYGVRYWVARWRRG